VERYVEEIGLYKRVAGCSIRLLTTEIRIIVRNCPICIEGEPTEEEEVSGYRDLARIETNRRGGGIALVAAEGIALKRPKAQENMSQNLAFTRLGVGSTHWPVVKKKVATQLPSSCATSLQGGLYSLIPPGPGGFRLRYGRARNTGLAAAGIKSRQHAAPGRVHGCRHPDQVEQPGKAAAVAPVSSIEGPTVRLLNGMWFVSIQIRTSWNGCP